MALIATNKGGANFPPAPSGMQLSRIYGVIDLGTHKIDFQGQDKGFARKVLFMFELPNHKHTFIEEKGPEPFVVSRRFTLSLHEKSALRAFLEGWRGKKMNDEELKGFDVAKLLDKTCYINIVHEPRKDGTGVRAEIKGGAMIPPEMKGSMHPPVNKPVYYEVTQGRDATFNSLPKWVKEEIQQCQEFVAGPANTTPTDATPQSGEDDSPF